MLANQPGVRSGYFEGDLWRRIRAQRAPRGRPGNRLGSDPGRPLSCASAAPRPNRTWSRRRSLPLPTRFAPLTGILAISDLLATSDLGERERRWADTIKAGAEHLANLATLFVDAAKTGRGGGNGGSSLRQDLFDLRALARSTGDSSPGAPQPRAFRPRSISPKSSPVSWSAIPFACAPRSRT